MRRGSILSLIGLGIVAGGIATAVALLVTWLPPVASKERARIDDVFWFTTIICIAIFALVAAVLLYSIMKFRAAPDDDSDGPPVHGHTGLEIVWTLIPTLLVTAIGIYSAVVLSQNDKLGKNVFKVNVTAQQFAWSFSYPEAHNLTTGVLRLPVNRSVELEFKSLDVIHSFWVPEFLFKLDVIPGNANGRNNVFQVTVRKEGAFVGRCAELCGEYHAFMNFEVRSVSPEKYDAYLKAREKGMDTRHALQSIGLPGTAVTTHPFNLDEHYQQSKGVTNTINTGGSGGGGNG
jgi:cytochrome c oxidase subunit II